MVCLRPRRGRSSTDMVTQAAGAGAKSRIRTAWAAESRIRKHSGTKRVRSGSSGGVHVAGSSPPSSVPALLWGEDGDLNAVLATVAVDPLGFGGLPLHVLILILAFLPLPVLVRFRLVCKSWDTLLRSRAFLQAVFSAQHSSASSSSSSWLVMARSRQQKSSRSYQGLLAPKELIAYCPPLHSWFPLPIDAHPGIVTALGPGLLRVPLREADEFPVLSALTMASSGGLICCAVNAIRTKPNYWAPPPPKIPNYGPRYLSMYVFDEYDYHVLVFNCFTGASKCLPPPLNRDISTNLFLYMFPDAATTGAYFVALIHSFGLQPSFHSFEIYSSQTGCWKVGQAITSVGDFSTFEDVQNGDLFYYQDKCSVYNVVSDTWISQDKSATLSAYNIGSDAWSRVSITPALNIGVSDYVFKFQGRIFVADALVDFGADPPVFSGFRVCELRSLLPGSRSASWVEVARTPSKYWQGFFDFPNLYPYPHINFVNSKNLVCMTSLDNSGNFFKGTYWPPLVYDLTCGTWYHLPPYKDTTDFLGLFSFQPKLLATP